MRCVINDIIINGDYDHIIRTLEGYGYQSKKENDFDKMHRFFQCADHWKREKKNAIYANR